MDWEEDADHDKELREEGPRLSVLGHGTLPSAHRDSEEELGPDVDWEDGTEHDKELREVGPHLSAQGDGRLALSSS